MGRSGDEARNVAALGRTAVFLSRNLQLLSIASDGVDHVRVVFLHLALLTLWVR